MMGSLSRRLKDLVWAAVAFALGVLLPADTPLDVRVLMYVACGVFLGWAARPALADDLRPGHVAPRDRTPDAGLDGDYASAAAPGIRMVAAAGEGEDRNGSEEKIEEVTP